MKNIIKRATLLAQGSYITLAELRSTCSKAFPTAQSWERLRTGVFPPAEPENACSGAFPETCGYKKRKPPTHCWIGGFSRKRQLPTLPLLRSTIGVTRFNFSVRNGKRWNPRAIATWIRCDMTEVKILLNGYVKHGKKVNGQLVMLGFDVTTFTPASYQRHRLWRPWEI